MSGKAKLNIDGTDYELPIIKGSEGETGVDITALRASTKAITLDNGFMNTGSCQSAITFLNGEKGILRYRGYPIEQLADNSNFLEVSYLLNYGELPTKDQLAQFTNSVKEKASLPEGVKQIIDQFPKDAHPMGVMASGMVALSGFYPEALGECDNEMKDQLFSQLLGQVKAMACHFFRRSVGKNPVDPDSSIDYSSDFLQMMFSGDGFQIDEDVAKALDVLLILHADHEQNCSASTVRVVGSSQANIFASISAGISALWGPLHGGANQAVLEMLEAIQNDGGDHKRYLEKARAL